MVKTIAKKSLTALLIFSAVGASSCKKEKKTVANAPPTITLSGISFTPVGQTGNRFVFPIGQPVSVEFQIQGVANPDDVSVYLEKGPSGSQLDVANKLGPKFVWQSPVFGDAPFSLLLRVKSLCEKNPSDGKPCVLTSSAGAGTIQFDSRHDVRSDLYTIQVGTTNGGAITPAERQSMISTILNTAGGFLPQGAAQTLQTLENSQLLKILEAINQSRGASATQGSTLNQTPGINLLSLISTILGGVTPAANLRSTAATTSESNVKPKP